MIDLFDPTTRASLLERLGRLRSDSQRQWGTMTPAQTCAHAAAALAVATRDAPNRQALIGKLLAWTVRSKLLGEPPFPKSSPTDPTFVIRDPRDFDAEQARLLAEIERFVALGPARLDGKVHTFLGRLSGAEWGVMMGKHLDHHLRQFGV
jgi:hypothetical protein